jgi:hypothetical protein
VLASILKLVSSRYTTTVRSNDWNEAIPVLEAGVEEAMTHLHDDTTPTANSWTADTLGGVSVVTKQRSFSDGSYFKVEIANFSSSGPTIYSQGYVRSPYKASQYISRSVKVAVTNPPTVFTKALATVGLISMVGHPLVDGFDSRKGKYDSSTNVNATGSIATDSTANPAISLGGATIDGSATTGPGGTVSGGTVVGGTNNNMNVAFPSNTVPTTPGTFLTESSSNVWNVGSGSFQMSSYNGDPIVITGNATILVNGGISISGGGSIRVMPGASVKMYVTGNVDIGGNGIVNDPGLAANFSLIGLAGCTSINYHGTPDFVGTINAPQADFTMKGTTSLFGAVIAKSASFNGNVAIHYDDSLAVSGLLIASGWTEQ